MKDSGKQENYEFPKTIHLLSDDTEVKFVREDIKAKEPTAFYEFTRSFSNLGLTFPMSQTTIENLKKNKLAICQ
jgi:hypothetical protein